MKIVNPYWWDSDNETRKKLRIKHTLSFIGSRNPGKVLNIGSAPQSVVMFRNMYDENIVKLDSTTGDLDVVIFENEKYDTYDTILFLEVIEHLFNPLHCLVNIRNVMSDNGRMYLSTPRRPFWMRNREHHFHEFQDNSLENLLKRAGFKVVKKKKLRNRPVLQSFKGFRSFLRIFLDKSVFIECKKVEMPKVIPIVDCSEKSDSRNN